MQHLYAPWRQKYFEQKEDTCVFCNIDEKEDEKRGVLFRAKKCYGILNLYPYTAAHFLIIPYKHLANLEELDNETWLEMSLYAKYGVEILKKDFKAGGINLGMNLGSVAGAGVAAHLHYHVLPRYFGDTNFISTIVQTRVCSANLEESYRLLKKAFDLKIKESK